MPRLPILKLGPGRLRLRRPPGPGPGEAIGSVAALDSGPASFAQQFPAGLVPPGSGVVVGGLPTQLDPLATWPDGSLRNAILSVAGLDAGTHALALGANATGTFTPSVPTASVTIQLRWPFQKLGTSYAVGAGGTLAVRLDQSTTGSVWADTIFLRRVSTGERLVRTFRDGPGLYDEVGGWASSSTKKGWSEPAPTRSSSYAVRFLGAGSGGSATWTFAGLEADDYEAYAIWSPASSRASAADYVVSVGGVEQATATVDQRADPEWDFVQTPDPDDAAYTATLPPGVGADLWRDGPICREWRRFEVPFLRHSDGQAHPWLTATFDVRCFAGGEAEVEVTVDNSLHRANATALIYLASLDLGGVEAVPPSRAGALQVETNDLTTVGHGWAEQWRWTMGTGGFRRNRVWCDYDLQVQAKALPRWRADTSAATLVDPATDPLWQGLYPVTDWASAPPSRNLSVPGGSDHRGPYPNSHVRARMAGTDQAHDVVTVGGRAWAGRAYRVREVADDPTYSGLGPWRHADPVGEKPQFYTRSTNSTADPAGVLRPKTLLDLVVTGDPGLAHMPLPSFVPWMITGDRSFADDLGAMAVYCVSASDPNDDALHGRKLLTGDYSDGTVVGDQVRDGGWMLRVLVEAGAWLPDSDPLKAWSRQRVDNTLAALDAIAVTHPMPIGPHRVYQDPPGPGSVFEGTRYYGVNGLFLGFVTWAIHRAVDLGCPHGSTTLDLITRWYAATWYGDSAEKQCGDTANPWAWPEGYKAITANRPRTFMVPDPEDRDSANGVGFASARELYDSYVTRGLLGDLAFSGYSARAFVTHMAFGIGVTRYGRPWQDAYAAAVAAGSLSSAANASWNLDFGLEP